MGVVRPSVGYAIAVPGCAIKEGFLVESGVVGGAEVGVGEGFVGGVELVLSVSTVRIGSLRSVLAKWRGAEQAGGKKRNEEGGGAHLLKGSARSCSSEILVWVELKSQAVVGFFDFGLIGAAGHT